MNSMKINVLRNSYCPMISQYSIIGRDKLGRDLNIDSGKFLTYQNAVLEKNLIPGFGLRLQNAKASFTAHIMPTIEDLKTLPDKIGEIVDKLREAQVKSFDETLAFITGGKHLEPNSPNYDDSMKVMDSLYGIIAEEKNVPTTVIAEHKNPNGTINLYARNRETTIYDENINGLLKKIKTTANPSQEEVEDILSEHFNFVEISPQIPVNIVDSLPEIIRK